MTIKWVESNRITDLEFRDIAEFSNWLKDQELNDGEVLEIIKGN